MSVSSGTGPNTAVVIGNPGLAPEKVTAYDASLSYYFAAAAVISVGFFHKRRTNLFVTQDFTPPCEGGRIYNPIADRNVFVDPVNGGNGLCVPFETTINDPDVTKQTGVEIAFQYDLTENINIGVEGGNLTKSEIKQYCVNDGGLLCFQGLPDRRLTFGASIKF